MREFQFTILLTDGDCDYLVYSAYSEAQAIFLFELDGYSRCQIIDTDII